MKAMITPASKQDHEREGALLNAALQRTGDERAAFLGHACGENLALRQRLEDLLRAHEEAGTFLGRPLAPASAAPSSLERAPLILANGQPPMPGSTAGLGVPRSGLNTPPAERF